MLTSPVCCAGMKSKLTAPSGTIRSASTTGIANVATVVDFVVPIERRKRNGPKRSTRREARGRRKSIPAPWASAFLPSNDTTKPLTSIIQTIDVFSGLRNASPLLYHDDQHLGAGPTLFIRIRRTFI